MIHLAGHPVGPSSGIFTVLINDTFSGTSSRTIVQLTRRKQFRIAMQFRLIKGRDVSGGNFPKVVKKVWEKVQKQMGMNAEEQEEE